MNRIVHRQKMFKLVEKYQASDIPKRQFCANHRVKMTTFTWWQQMYRKENNNNGPENKIIPKPAFIPVKIPLNLNNSCYEYCFPGGSRFIIPETTSISDIITLVKGLQGKPCSQ